MSEPLTRARVVAVARAQVAADGVESLSLRAVARGLGVTAPALYGHVANKADLVAAIAEEYFDELADRFARVAADDPLDAIRALSRAYVAHALAEPELFRLLFRFPPATGVSTADHAARPPEFDPATRAFSAAATAMREAIDAGLLAVSDPVAASMTMWAAVHGVAEVLLLGFGFDDATAEVLIDSVIETVLAGQRHH